MAVKGLKSIGVSIVSLMLAGKEFQAAGPA